MNQLPLPIDLDEELTDCRPPVELMTAADLRRVFVVCETGELGRELEARGLMGKKEKQ